MSTLDSWLIIVEQWLLSRKMFREPPLLWRLWDQTRQVFRSTGLDPNQSVGENVATGCSNNPDHTSISGYEERIDVIMQTFNDSGVVRENPKLARYIIRLSWRLCRHRIADSAEASMEQNQNLRSRWYSLLLQVWETPANNYCRAITGWKIRPSGTV